MLIERKDSGTFHLRLPQTNHVEPLVLGSGIQQLAVQVQLRPDGSIGSIGSVGNVSTGKPSSPFQAIWSKVPQLYFRFGTNRLPPDQSAITGNELLDPSG
jgi:hypothetical protein